jgi:hypothetical protein
MNANSRHYSSIDPMATSSRQSVSDQLTEFHSSDRATSEARVFEPGQLLFFKMGVIHAFPEIFEEPIVFLSVDAPRRDSQDIIFVNPGDGTPETFIKGIRHS